MKVLRKYQIECIEKSISDYKNGLQRIAVSLPVGSGKTVILSHLIHHIPASIGKKTLVLAHRSELLQQAYKTIKLNSDLNIGRDYGKNTPLFENDVIIASVNALGRKHSKRLLSYDPNDFKAIIIDEAHHAAASTYQNILNHFDVFNPKSQIKVWGCSATLRRHDGVSLQPTFQTISYHLPISELMASKHLCQVKYCKVNTKVSISNVPKLKSTGDYKLSELAKVINIPERNELIISTYIKFNTSPAIIFAANVQHIHDLVETFSKHGITAYGISAKTPKREREVILNEFSNGVFPVLINCGILTEGVDIPAIRVVGLARPSLSAPLIMQMIGRGMRNFKGKDHCIVFDLVDCGNVLREVTPSLLGVTNHNGNSLDTFKSNCSTNTDNFHVSQIRVSEILIESEMSPFTDPFKIGNIEKDVEHIRKYTRLPWIRTGNLKWILPIPKRKAHVVLSFDTIFQAYMRKRRSNHVLTKKLILENDDLKYAFHGIETYITKEFGYKFVQDLKQSKWQKAPITKEQLNTLEKFRLPTDGVITRGMAHELITRYIFGAMKSSSSKISIKRNL